MASTEVQTHTHDRHARRRPFANWMKRLANLKNLHTEPASSRQSGGRKLGMGSVKNSPSKHASPVRSEQTNGQPNGHTPSSVPLSSAASRNSLDSRGKVSMTLSQDGQNPPKSRAPTLGTTAETTVSGAGTSATAPRTEGDRDSTFSSREPSLRSMTTTLTTMQSTTPVIAPPNIAGSNPVYSSTQPASAVPAHLVSNSHHPATYHTATANNVLSDDASMLTLASSSKRRRRNSVDTNASMRALAPQSMFGGSRESLPLSVLSGSAHPNANNRDDNASFRDNASVHYPRSISAMNVERASLISASGVTAPALTSERNSYISNKPAGDGASVRSGLLGHGDKERDRSLYHARNDSIGGLSIARDRIRETPRENGAQDYFREPQMVTAPTSPMPA
ncbi:hypothetical protein OHC33_008525 [Knufia fluminis]|uniref:Uncharacterized protein n=1 Tax=Knufia fluminis TaxID=191047 RepID=A0AAN8I244_9EURO|nr:hypothetical protein OHC33_008525 [Knufia fluminis]